MADAVEIGDSAISGTIGVALQLGEAALISAEPVLGFPVIKQLWEYFLEKYVGLVSVLLQKSFNTLIIAKMDKAQEDAANLAAEMLRKAQNDPTLDHQKAIDDFKAKYADLIGFRKSTP